MAIPGRSKNKAILGWVQAFATTGFETFSKTFPGLH